MKDNLITIIAAIITAIPGTGALILNIIKYRDSKKK